MYTVYVVYPTSFLVYTKLSLLWREEHTDTPDLVILEYFMDIEFS